jgi:hypothetical protein
MRLQQENSYFCVIRVGPLNSLPKRNEFCHFYLHGVCDKEIIFTVVLFGGDAWFCLSDYPHNNCYLASESTIWIHVVLNGVWSWVWCAVLWVRLELTGRFLFEDIICRVCVIHILTSLLNVCSIRGYLCLFSSRSCSILYRVQLYALLTKRVLWQNKKRGLWPFCSPDLDPCDIYL